MTSLLVDIILIGPPLIVAVVLHEYAHGYVAKRLGDPTATSMGRLSLNPIRHIDPMMTILLPLLLIVAHSPVVFGGAKPIPVNPYNFKNPRRGMMWVALAGPLTNFALATIALAYLAAIYHSGALTALPDLVAFFLLFWGLYSVVVNIVLGVFNLIPIPPLDGGRIAVGILPVPIARAVASLERIGLLIVFALLSMHLIDYILIPAVNGVNHAICLAVPVQEFCGPAVAP